MKTLKLTLLCATLALGHQLFAQDVELTREIAARYEQMLLRSPEAGTAFDRVIEWHSTGGGGLEVLEARWRSGAESDDDGSVYRLLLGMLAERRRAPGEARDFYLSALDHPPTATAAARLLAALETREGNFPAATAAYGKALAASDVPPPDRLDLMRSLALVHQRAFENEKAVGVWREAVQSFPEDTMVLEEASEAFLVAGDFDAARTTLAKLAELSDGDPFKKVSAGLQLARVADLEGNTDEAAAIMSGLLEETSPGSWINREIRSRLEDLFRQRDDLPGLLAFYEARRKSHPQDTETLAAMAEVLAGLSRHDEATAVLRNAVELAPENEKLGLALVQALVRTGAAEEALTHARELARPASASDEVYVLLGNLLWERFEITGNSEDREEAILAWGRPAPPDSKDTAAISRFATLLAAKNLEEEALAQWRRVVALAPGASDARAQIADILSSRGEDSAAREILADLIEGPEPDPAQFQTLANLQTSREWFAEAAVALRRGLELYPENFDLLSLSMRFASEHPDHSPLPLDQSFARAFAAAPNEYFADDVVKRYAAALSGGEKEAGPAIEALAGRVSGGTADPGEARVLLVLACGERDEPRARIALDAIEMQANPVRHARARVAFAAAFGLMDDQIAAHRAVAEADPRLAVESLAQVARLEATAGRLDEALATAAALIERAPGDPSHYMLSANLASQGGRLEEAIATLEDGIRLTEENTSLRLQLADLHQARGAFSEAASALDAAFANETSDGRRLEIFRRQIQLAMVTGTLDDLIASLRERQTREQGGARYGIYLAEIFLQQNDYLAAREELTRSLGRTPDSPTAIGRLIELSDRAGDREEGLRLATRLAEVDPSPANRANVISRLIEAGETAQALEAVAAARPVIAADPGAWSEVLAALNRPEFDAYLSDLLVDIQAAASDDPASRFELAKLHLARNDRETATALLWGILETADLAAALDSTFGGGDPGQPVWPGLPGRRGNLQAFHFLQSSVQQSLAQLMQGHYRGLSRGMFGGWMMGGRNPVDQLSPADKATLNALIALDLASRAAGKRQEFSERFEALAARKGVSLESLFLLATIQQDFSRIEAIVDAQTDAENPDPALDALIASSFPRQGNGTDPRIQKIAERVAAQNPAAAFNKAVENLNEELRNAFPDVKPYEQNPGIEAMLAGRVEELAAHPGLEANPAAGFVLVNLAARAGNFDLAWKLLESAEEAAEDEAAGTGNAQQLLSVRHQFAYNRVSLALHAILAGEPAARERFLQVFSETGDRNQRPMTMVLGPGAFFGHHGSQVLNQGAKNLLGDSKIPFALIHQLRQLAAASGSEDELVAWFAKNAPSSDLDELGIASVYLDWIRGDEEAAVERVEKLHQANPTPRSAALLMELYEKSDRPGEALALIEEASFQPGETGEIRAARKLRLMRQAGETEAARKLGGQLARSRLSQPVRQFLSEDFSQLGIPQMPVSTGHRVSRSPSRPDRASAIRQQIEKLADDGKTDEAEALAAGILAGPMPVYQDYETRNMRQNAISALRKIERIESHRNLLQERLHADPGDIDAALRLAELSEGEDRAAGARLLEKAVTAHPGRATNLEQIVAWLQQDSERHDVLAEIVATMIEKQPALVARSGLDLMQIAQITDEPPARQRLAKALAGLDDRSYADLFFRSRLTSQSESGLLSSLATAAADGGDFDSALILLGRANDADSIRGMNQNISTDLIKVKMLLKAGRKEEAAAALISTAHTPQGRLQPMRASTSPLAAFIINSMHNHFSGPGAVDPLAEVAELARETGTADELISALDEEESIPKPLSPSLLFRTALGDPKVGQDWAKIADQAQMPAHLISAGLLRTVLRAMAERPDAKTSVPAFLAKLPDSLPFMGGGNTTLSMIAETIPLLEPYGDEPGIGRFIDAMVRSALSDPNGAQYFVHSREYFVALQQLLASGRIEQARRLFDFTSAARSASRRYVNERQLDMIEARLLAAEGVVGGITVVCAASGHEPGKPVTVRWQVAPQMPGDSNRTPGAEWEPFPTQLPKKALPRRLEILAGPNPAALKVVAKIESPGSQGARDVALPGSVGLLQARWTLQNGEASAGPLGVYVLGESVGSPASAQTEGTEPWIDASAPTGPGAGTLVSRSDPSNPIRIPFIENIPLADLGDRTLVVSGWVSSASGQGSSPRLMLATKTGGGRRSDDRLNQPDTALDLWGQVTGTWSSNRRNSGSLPENATSADLFIEIYANFGMNNLYFTHGAWDSIRAVIVDSKELFPDLSDIIDAARQKLSDNPGSAADTFLKLIAQDPHQVFDRAAMPVFEAFERSGRLDDLYAVVSAPAMYFPDPLRRQRPAIQNRQFESRLLDAALANPSPAGSKWLSMLRAIPLRDDLRLLVQSATLRQKIASGENVPPSEVLGLLGFSDPPDESRLREIWSNSQKSTIELVDAVVRQSTPSELLAGADAAPLPAEFLLARSLLKAFLLVGTDPASALAAWQESLQLRQGPNSVNLSSETDNTLFARLAQNHPSPGDVVATARNWIAQTSSSDPSYQARRLSEMLYRCIRPDGEAGLAPNPALLTHWQDAKLALLKFPDASAHHSRVATLIETLREAKDWDRIESTIKALESRSKKMPSTLREQIDGLRSMVDLANGRLDGAWPVAWVSFPGESRQKALVHYQWGLQNLTGNGSDFSSAVTVAPEPLVDVISGQEAVEFLFGPSVNELQVIARIDGDASTGSTKIELPAQNGLLRAVAVVNGGRHPGPLFPVVNGRRLFPGEENPDLGNALAGGIEAEDLSIRPAADPAPDGSPAFALERDSGRSTLNFRGADIPIEAGKIYVIRSWLRRAGTGTGTLNALIDGPDAKKIRDLTMVLAEDRGLTGQWTYYSRVLPILPSHTFWIPFREVTTFAPQLRNAHPGTQVAGFEIIELGDEWPYTNWLRELAMLREEAGDEPDPEILRKALNLAGQEPLTALDYHGDWMAQNGIPHDLGEQVLALYGEAFHAEPNPLFAAPKYWRLFNNLRAIADHKQAAPQLRQEAARLALTQADRQDPQGLIGFHRRLIDATPPGPERDRAVAAAGEFVKVQLGSEDTARSFLSSLTNQATYRDDRAQSELLTFCRVTGDAGIRGDLAAGLRSDAARSLPGNAKAFALLGIEDANSETGEAFEAAADKAFALTEGSDSIREIIFWPTLLANFLVEDPANKSEVIFLRRRAFERGSQVNKFTVTELRELARIAQDLVPDALAAGDRETAATVAAKLEDRAKQTGRLFEDMTRMLGRVLDALHDAGAEDLAAPLAEATRKQAEAYPEANAAWSR